MHLIIIGNGITGVTAALTVRRLQPDARITLISDESEHHYSRTALMYVYMGHLRYPDIKPYEDWFWRENNLELVHATANRLDIEQRTIFLDNSQSITYDKLLLATGSVSKYFDWPGQHLLGVQGLYGLPDLASMERDTHGIRSAVVVGGGLIGIEMAEMLHTRGIAVTLLVRHGHYWGGVLPPEEAHLIDRQLEQHHVPVRYHTELHEIRGDAGGRVQSVLTTKGETIDCQWVGIAVGVTPNLGITEGSAVETDKGILVDEMLQTNVPDVYAAGDCAQHRQAGAGEVPIEQLWYTGRMQGETVAHTICGRAVPYRRGVWFNSAKFFNLEYQTYGRVPVRHAPGEESFYWEHPTKSQCLRINFQTPDSQAVIGFNALGMRLRHDVCEHWIKSRASVRDVLASLGAANFDPEFFRQHEPAIVRQFNQQFPQYATSLKQRKGLGLLNIKF